MLCQRTIQIGALLSWVTLLSLAQAPAQPAASAKTPAASRPAEVQEAQLQSYADWKAACRKLPSNRASRGRLPAPALLPLPRFRELDELVSAFFTRIKSGPLGDTNTWTGELPSASGFYNTDSAYFVQPETPTTGLIQQFLHDTHPLRSSAPVAFQPFAQKVEVPPGAELFLHADLHGDLRSLLTDLDWLNQQKYLDGFQIVRPDFYMVFFGDYTDRGNYGIEGLYTLLRLKLANPDRVFLGRGNHEEVSIASRYGFLSEGRVKYGADFDPKKILRAYDFLPVVLYVGAAGNFVQLNHGGMEPGYDPRALLAAPGAMRFQFLGPLKQRGFAAAHPDWIERSDDASSRLFAQHAQDFQPLDPLNPSLLGFMWNDFSVFAEEPGFAVDPGRAFVYGQHTTQYLLRQTRTGTQSVQAIFRGHQQSSIMNPMMRRLVASRGIFRHWQEKDSRALADADLPTLQRVLEHGESRAIPPGSVWTLNISPDTAYGEACGFDFETVGLLKTAAAFNDWRLRVVNLEVAF